MMPMTVSELREALAGLLEQNAPVLVWTNGGGEAAPRVIDTGQERVLAVSWDHLREVYVIHTSEAPGL